VKQRKLSVSVRETLEKAALLGTEFSVPVLLSAGASPEGLDRLFDDGWLAEAGPNRARFVQKARFQDIAAAIPWSRKRKRHSELARACEALRQPPGDVAHHHLEAREFEAPGLYSFEPPKRHAVNDDFVRRSPSSEKHLIFGLHVELAAWRGTRGCCYPPRSYSEYRGSRQCRAHDGCPHSKKPGSRLRPPGCNGV
jgi:hypothetical protein